MNKKLTIQSLLQMKKKGIPIAALTAYDFPTARLLDEAGIDLVLVGDSVGMVVQGDENTLAVTIDHMVYHARIVSKAVSQALVVADMPFGSYHESPAQAVRNAVRLMKESRCDAVKVEGGRRRLEAIRAILAAEIPVMGHIGLTPQSVHRFGGFKIQGRRMEDAESLIDDGITLQEAGCFSLILEGIPESVSRIITGKLQIPTIGIGAGPHCDGQILVFHDMMGLHPGTSFRFVRQYAQLADLIRTAVGNYQADVRARHFPSLDESFTLDADLKAELEKRHGSHCENQ